MNSQPPMASKNKRIILLALGGLACVILLAGAGFLVGQLMNPAGSGSPWNSLSSLGLGHAEVVGRPGKSALKPAAELPPVASDTRGLFIRRADNSLFLGTGHVQVHIAPNTQPQESYDGPVVEIVVTGATKVYQDVTSFPAPDAQPPSESIQQKVAPGNLDDLTSASLITVWGKKTGERYVAEVILYEQP